MKPGPRARRIAERDTEARHRAETEIYVRSKMKPELVASAKKAGAAFKSESFGLFTRDKPGVDT